MLSFFRGREKDRGEREKITNTKKFMEFYLVVLQFTVVLQSGYQRQGGKEKDRKRDGLCVRERERKI